MRSLPPMSNTTRHNSVVRPERPRAALFVAALGMMFCGAVAFAAGEPQLEQQVKAAFVVKFGMFVEWPASVTNTVQKAEPFEIGILGDDPFREFVDEAAKKARINGRTMTVRRAKELSALDGCRIFFIGENNPDRVKEILPALHGKPVLTVGDAPGFAGLGGMIGLYKQDGRLRFEINPAVAEKSRLKVSAKLLVLGKIVAPGSTEKSKP